MTQYAAAKQTLLNTFGESDESRIRKLLHGQSLGDNKPTQFLQKLKNLASGHVGDTVLKSIFLEQMPDQIRTILSVTDCSIQVLAEQADKIFEVLKPPNVCEIKNQAEASLPQSIISEITLRQLSEQIKALESKIEKLQGKRNRSLSRDSTSFKSNRSDSRSRKWCWYHRRFGERSTKCTSPCSYAKN
ncbi:uncharacterized protein LOC124418764 [Lucilia cuprina]|uniref:uncharacterized protein LOC124418764 n=1 Tax=Lucilia cuprina TaxID=7375 RepID=UPI001F051A68|nr:uncharacterized protein LOC124418764 [Lucilia cuprina]